MQILPPNQGANNQAYIAYFDEVEKFIKTAVTPKEYALNTGFKSYILDLGFIHIRLFETLVDDHLTVTVKSLNGDGIFLAKMREINIIRGFFGGRVSIQDEYFRPNHLDGNTIWHMAGG